MPVYPHGCEKCKVKKELEIFLLKFFEYGLTSNPSTGETDIAWYVPLLDGEKVIYVDLEEVIDFYLASVDSALEIDEENEDTKLNVIRRKKKWKKQF